MPAECVSSLPVEWKQSVGMASGNGYVTLSVPSYREPLASVAKY